MATVPGVPLPRRRRSGPLGAAEVRELTPLSQTRRGPGQQPNPHQVEPFRFTLSQNARRRLGDYQALYSSRNGPRKRARSRAMTQPRGRMAINPIGPQPATDAGQRLRLRPPVLSGPGGTSGTCGTPGWDRDLGVGVRDQLARRRGLEGGRHRCHLACCQRLLCSLG